MALAASTASSGVRATLPGGHGNAVLGEQLLGLVFVEVHANTLDGGAAESGRSAGRRAAAERAAIVPNARGKGKKPARTRGYTRGVSRQAAPGCRRSACRCRSPSGRRPPDQPGRRSRRELYFFSLYRVLEAGAPAPGRVQPAGAPLAAGESCSPRMLQAAALVYLVAVGGSCCWSATATGDPPAPAGGHRPGRRPVAVPAPCSHVDGGDSGIAMLLLFNIGAGALMLTADRGLGFAAGRRRPCLLGEYRVRPAVRAAGDARSVAEAADVRGHLPGLGDPVPACCGRQMRETPGAGRQARRRARQPVPAQRPDHPAHAHRRAGRGRQPPHPACPTRPPGT